MKKYRTTLYQTTLQDIKEARQKSLDKIDELVYTNLMRLGKTNMNTKLLEVPFAELPFTTHLQQKERIEILHKEISNILEKESPGSKAVIAGGSIRDTILGYRLKDYDVFLSLAPEEDSPEDFITFLSLKFKKLYPEEYRDLTFLSKGSYGRIPDSFGPVAMLPTASFGQAPIEFIVDSKASDPEALVARFDHDLVRCAYDGRWLASESFLDLVKKSSNRRIFPRDAITHNRLWAWRDRTGFPIRISNPPKAKKPATEETSYTRTSGIEYSAVRSTAGLNDWVLRAPLNPMR